MKMVLRNVRTNEKLNIIYKKINIVFYLVNLVENSSFFSINARIDFVEYFKWKLVFSNNEGKLISDPDRKKKINKGKFVLGNVRTKPKSNILFGKNKVTFSGTFAIQLEMTF